MSDLPFSAKWTLPHGRWLKAILTMFLSLFLLVGTSITLNADAQGSRTDERPFATNDMLTESFAQDWRLDSKLTVVETQENVSLSPFNPWTSGDSDDTKSLAWGDVDGDGDLDLAAGNGLKYDGNCDCFLEGGANKLYLNEGDTLQMFATWTSSDHEYTNSIAWGDVDGDGDLDLAAANAPRWNGSQYVGGANKLYLNEGGVLQTAAAWTSDDNDYTTSIAWGDMDGDGYLDLAAGNNGQANKVYLNVGGVLQTAATWTAADSDYTTSIAWGDMDGDGYLDLAAGNSATYDSNCDCYAHGANKVYLNENGILQTTAVWVSDDDSEFTESVAWGDMDGDGNFDLAVGNFSGSKVYLNEGNILQATAAWASEDSEYTKSVAWGDMDGDGDLDLAAGNSSRASKVYLNEGTILQTTAAWTSANLDETLSIAWGDMDGDGDLDLAAGNIRNANKVYLNKGAFLQTAATWLAGEGANERTYSIVWGDMDGDGDLDLAAGNGNPLSGGQANKVYLNEGYGLQKIAVWTSADRSDTLSLAWGDVDGDGDLDLAAGNGNEYAGGQANKLYLNKNGSLQETAAWTSGDSDWTWSMAWGDVDGDGYLDLAAGNGNPFGGGQANKLYLNKNGSLQTVAAWVDTDQDDTNSVAWGDVDGDGDLDLAAGNGKPNGKGQSNKLYLNVGGVLQPAAVWVSSDSDATKSLAWGDMDGDGDLDLAVGNDGQANKVYLNAGGVLQTTPGWSSGDSDQTYSVAWGDVDGDGDLDLVTGNFISANKVYLNEGGILQTAADTLWTSGDSDATWSVAWGDVDGDGDLDLAAGNEIDANKLYLNGRGAHDLPVNASFLTVSRPITPAITSFYVPPQIVSESVISIPVILYDYEGDAVGQIRAEYSPNGGGQWFPAISTTDTATSNLQTNTSFGQLIAEWRFDRGQGVIATNGISSTLNGTLINGTTWTTDTAPLQYNNSYALSFDGIDDYMSAPAPSSLVGNHSFTVSFWLKYNPTPSRSWVMDIGARLNANQALHWLIHPDGSTQFGVWGVTALQNTPNISAYAGKWVHVTTSFDASSKVLKTYFNGVEVDSDTGVNPINIQPAGGMRIGLPITGESYHQGLIDDVRIYGKALPADEVHTLAEGWRSITYTFYWDTFASGFFGQSDNVVFRLEAYPQPATSGTAGSYQYVNSTPFPIQRPYASAVTFPFRVRGTQVQVFSETISTENAVPDALVYQQSGGGLGQPMANEATSVPFTTDSNGYLSGRGQLAIGDNLFAALPMTTTYRTPPQLIFGGADSLGTVGLHAPPASAATAEFWLLPTASDGELFTLGGLTLANPADLTINGQTTGISVDDGFPHHVALSWQDSGAWELVVDGNSVANGTANTSLSSSLTIGNGYSGSLDEIRLWNVVRSSGQISTTLFTLLSGTEAGLVGYWPVEADDVGVVADHSSNGNDLSLSGDASVAFKPLYTVYHTSGAPTASGVEMFEVTKPGVQQLVVSKNNPLMLFDLIVSLEWDASGDPDYLERLEQDIGRASEILYDLTNGQVAFGTVQVYQNKEQWHEADIQIYANNNQRPNANLGGIVTNILSDTLKNGEVVGNAFVPGKIRIGATWNRYGNPGGTVGEDWPRVMAHEFGHYALFLLDNYLGVATVNGNKIITEIDCAGSAMTDAYRQDYSEFLSETANSSGNGWLGSQCQQSLAEDTTGRSDWETIQTFYPFLNENIATTQTGPTSLPLAVTQVTINTPDNELTLLDTPVFYITDDMGNLIPFTRGEGQAYLYQKKGTAALEDDDVLFLGSPSGPLVNARGAAVGDKLCVYDNGHVPPRVGCLDNLGNSDATLVLQEVNNWLPEITVRPVNSTTFVVTVTQASAANIHVQLFPSYRPTETVEALTGQLTDIGNNTYVGQFEFPLTVFDGYARVWQDGTPNKETISRFANAPGWDGNRFVGFGGNTFVGFGGNRFVGFGGNRFVGFGGNTFVGFGGNRFVGFGGNTFVGFGGNRFVGFGGNTFVGFNAPLASPDGQVILYNVDNILAGNVASSLQVLPSVPQLPTWLTPVGQVYRYTTQENEGDNLVIQFQYLQRELPAIEEEQLKIYYLDEDDPTAEWQRIENTTIDDFRNLASAKMRGEGLYALVATIELPPLDLGWNIFAYPSVSSRPVAEALASLNANVYQCNRYCYTSVYQYQSAQGWLLYDQTAPAPYDTVVNTLESLQPLNSYWIYATKPLTLYIQPSTAADRQATPELPPATYYGLVSPSSEFSPQIGDVVEAYINDTVCGTGEVTNSTIGLIYVVQVKADNGNGCGAAEREIVFTIDGQTMPHTAVWNNTVACFHPLDFGSTAPTVCEAPSSLIPIYLPVILRR